MRNVITAIFFLFFVFGAFCQKTTNEKELSKAELFSAKAGTLIERQFLDIGKVEGIEIRVLKLKDLTLGTSESALRFEYEYRASYGSATKIGVLDADEVDGLIKSIKNLQEKVFTSKRDIYTEVTFKSRTGFEAGAYYTVLKDKWEAYIKIDRFDSNSMVFFKIEDFNTFAQFIETAKSKM